MIAGPNGAGKTTTALSLISDAEVIDEFLNADEIARGVAPIHPESVSLIASKLMINRFKSLVEANKNLAFETTASGVNYIKHLKDAQAKGYEIQLLFLWLYSPELAVMRVEHRVSQGGHDIPEKTIRRRYYSGIRNLIKHYLPLSDRALILDNSKAGLNNVIARKDLKEELMVIEPNIWKEIEGIADVTES